MAEGPQHEKTLMKVIVFATGVSFGSLGAVIASMKGFFHGEVSFHFSFGSVAGFLIGFVAGWLFWKLVFWRGHKNESPEISSGAKR